MKELTKRHLTLANLPYSLPTVTSQIQTKLGGGFVDQEQVYLVNHPHLQTNIQQQLLIQQMLQPQPQQYVTANPLGKHTFGPQVDFQ